MTSGIAIFLLLPIVQTACFLYAIGGEIRDLKLGIVNDETSILSCEDYDRNLTAIPDVEAFTCNFTNLSCRFLEYLEHPMIDKVNRFYSAAVL